MESAEKFLEGPSSNLFVVRGNRLQVLDFATEAVLREVVFQSKPEMLDLKSELSPSRNFYTVYCPLEFAIFDMTGSNLTRQSVPGLSKAGFLDKKDDFFYYVCKKETNYLFHLFTFDKGTLTDLHRFDIPFFKPSFEYVKFEPQNQLFFVHNKVSAIETYGRMDQKLFYLESIEPKSAIVEFYPKPEKVFVTFSDSLNGKPTTSLKVYNIENGTLFTEEHYRAFNNVQELKFFSNSSGSINLINAHRYLDNTGTSYYGLEKVFMYNLKEKVVEEVPTYKGGIHDVKFDASEKQFAVTSGTMPSFTALYDAKGKPFYLLSNDYKNQLYFAPNKAFVAIVGFGSLAGDIEIWDYTKFEKIGYCNSTCASFLKWSSDCQYFMTAVVVEKLKVDHRISIFSYNGTLLKRIKMDVFDLINVDFAFNAPINNNIILNPVKRKRVKEPLGADKLLPSGKITSLDVQSYKPTQELPVQAKPGPTLQVGAPKFFNSRKGNLENGFKKSSN